MSECTMTDGTHLLAEEGHDMCVDCETYLLSTLDPVEIDTRLAHWHSQYTTAITKAMMAREDARTASPKGRYPSEKQEAHYNFKVLEYETLAASIRDEMRPLEAEYARRGGWTRAFVVADGHVHSSMECSTCNNGQYPTEFGWVTEFSGKTEAEVIEAAGSRACTVCYPNAPVDAPAGRIFHQTELEAQAAREERAAKKAIADEKKAKNAFGPYRTTGKWGDLLDTVYKAKWFLTDGAQWGWNHPSFLPQDREAVAALLGEKLGTTADEQIAAAAKRAANRS